MKKLTIIPALLLSIPLIGCKYSNSSDYVDINRLMISAKGNSYTALFFSSGTAHSYQDYDFVICDAIQQAYGNDLKPIKKNLDACDNYLSYQATLPSGPGTTVSWFNLTIRADGYITSEYGWFRGKLASGDDSYVYKVDESINLALINLATSRFEQIDKTIKQDEIDAKEKGKIENLFTHLEESNENVLGYAKYGGCLISDTDKSLLNEIKNINFVYSNKNDEDSELAFDSLISYKEADDWSLHINSDLNNAIVYYNYEGTYSEINIRIPYSVVPEEVQLLIDKIEYLVNL